MKYMRAHVYQKLIFANVISSFVRAKYGRHFRDFCSLAKRLDKPSFVHDIVAIVLSFKRSRVPATCK